MHDGMIAIIGGERPGIEAVKTAVVEMERNGRAWSIGEHHHR